MNGEQLVDEIRENEGTALSRLGSDKYLIAATGATLETPAVLAVGAASAATGRDCFEAWAEESEGGVADAFAAAAGEERDQYDRIVAEMDGDEPVDDSAVDDPVRDVLDQQDRTIERVAAGFVGRGLIRERTTLQLVNFFINEGDEGRADLFRTVRASADDDIEVGGDLLVALCEDDADWERARVAAESVIEVAYEDYVSTLESMGVDPKPVC